MTPLETVQRFVAHINAHDIPGLTALMTTDHRFTDSLGAPVTGREAMREGWHHYLQMVPDYTVHITHTFADGTTVVLLGTAAGTYNRGGPLAPVDAWQTPAAWRAVVRDEQVAEWQVYADNEPIRQLMRREAP